MSLAQYNNNIVTIGSALVVPQVDGTVRDSELNTISTSISPTVNIDAIPRSCTTGNGIPVTATNSDKNSDVDSGALNVNNILQDADNVAIAAQTIALPPGTMTGATNVVGSESTMNSTGNPMQGPVAAATSNAAIGNFNSGAKSSNTVFNNPVNMGNVNNLNQYILASSSVPTAALPVVQTPAVPYINNNNYNATPANPFAPAAAAPATDPNALNGNATPANQHFQSAIFQQNAAIMQQNAATLQHLQNLHQTNKLMAANPEAASTLGMLAPVMNMNLAATANPVQLLATATPSLNMNPANASAGTSLPPAKASQAPSDFNGAFATAPVGTQPQQQQGMLIPVPLGTMTIASRASQTFPAAGFPNNSGNNRTTDGSNNNDAVQNILRTAFMLQNSGLPFLQQGMISQQHQRQLMPVPAASGGLVMVPNATNANSTLLGIAPATISAQTSDAHGSENSGKKVDVGKNGNGLTSGAAAAANAAASVLPPASMNLPLQQQLQQQQQQQQQLQQQRLQFQQYHPVQQMGIDLNSNNNNTIALLGGAALNNNDGIQVPGLATLQQQQYNKAMVFPPMNLSDPHSQLPLPLVLPQQQQKQQLSNPAAVKLNQQVPQSQKKQTSISRPLYLDHDSNCKFLF